MAEMVTNIGGAQGASGGRSQAHETAGRRVAGEAKSAAAGVAEEARHIAAAGAARSADDIGEAARALRRTGGELRGNVTAPYFDRAAEGLDRLSGFLRAGDAHDVVRRVERYARREPLLFLGGSFALGVLAARFLKSSAHHHDHQPRSFIAGSEPPRRTP